MANRQKKNTQYRQGLRTLGKYLRQYQKQITVLAILSLLSAVGNAATPYLGGKLLDAMFGHAKDITILAHRINSIPIILAAWLFSRLLMDIAGRFKNVRQENFGAIIDADYMVNGFSKLLLLPVSFHKKHKMGEITTRLQRASSWLEQIINRIIVNLAPDFFSIILAVIITLFIKPQLSLLLLAAITIYIGILLRVAPKLSTISHKMQKAYSRAYGDAYDAVLNVQAVKQATAEEYEKKKLFRNFRLKAARLWTDYIRIGGNLNFTQGLLITFTQFSLFLASLYFVRRGQLTVGELVAFNGYAAMLFGPFVTLGRNWDLLQNGLVAIERAESIFRLAEEIYQPGGAKKIPNLQGTIEYRHVNFRYGRKQVEILRDISFTAHTGQSVALVGESGVGKTTLMELLSFYHKPTAGKIFVDGYNISELNLSSLRQSIAVVPQEVILFNETVKNNIRYGRFGATDAEVTEASRLAHADEFISVFPKKYNQIVGERGIKLSTGQKQRIAIARAILRNPKILVLDEPTSALDAKSEKYISESLEYLMRGRTTFIIAHRLSTVRKADIILVLERGQIKEVGQHQELLQMPEGIYRKLYELQVGLK